MAQMLVSFLSLFTPCQEQTWPGENVSDDLTVVRRLLEEPYLDMNKRTHRREGRTDYIECGKVVKDLSLLRK